MTPEEFAQALERIGFSPAAARIPIPQIEEGQAAESRDYHIVHKADGSYAIEVPDERGNGTNGVWWGEGPAVFATADEARGVIFQMIERKKAIYG
ncbi:hypothetical protein BH11ACT3_BH11ACT3_12420 [soil metagenome]